MRRPGFSSAACIVQTPLQPAVQGKRSIAAYITLPDGMRASYLMTLAAWPGRWMQRRNILCVCGCVCVSVGGGERHFERLALRGAVMYHTNRVRNTAVVRLPSGMLRALREGCPAPRPSQRQLGSSSSQQSSTAKAPHQVSAIYGGVSGRKETRIMSYCGIEDKELQETGQKGARAADL